MLRLTRVRSLTRAALDVPVHKAALDGLVRLREEIPAEVVL